MLPPKKPNSINATEDPGFGKTNGKNTPVSKLSPIGDGGHHQQKISTKNITTVNRSVNNEDPVFNKSNSKNTIASKLSTVDAGDPYLHKAKPKAPQATQISQNSRENLNSIRKIETPGTPVSRLNAIDDPGINRSNSRPQLERISKSISAESIENRTQNRSTTISKLSSIAEGDPYLHKAKPRNNLLTANKSNNTDTTPTVTPPTPGISTTGISLIQDSDLYQRREKPKSLSELTIKSIGRDDPSANKTSDKSAPAAGISSINEGDLYLHKARPKSTQSTYNLPAKEQSSTTKQVSIPQAGSGISAIDEVTNPYKTIPRINQINNNRIDTGNNDDKPTSTIHTVTKISAIDEGDPYLHRSIPRPGTESNTNTLENNGDPVLARNTNVNKTTSGVTLNSIDDATYNRKITSTSKNNIDSIKQTDDPALAHLKNYSFNGSPDELKRIVTTSNTYPSTTQGVQSTSTSTSTVPSETVIGPQVYGLTGDQITTNTIESVVTTPDGTVVIVNTDKEVFVNTYEEVIEQKYITNNLGTDTLGVGLAVGNQYSGVVDPAIKLGFDSNYFTISQIGSEVAKISLTGIASGSGYSGLSGWSGFSGSAGAPGISGYSGEAGSAGIPGASGYSGEAGSTGFSGYSGEAGSPGLPGASGYSGETGSTGTSGFSGYSGQSFTGDYVSYIQAGTGVSVSGTSGTAGVPIVSIGQPVAITDNVIFQNIHIASGGTLTFQDDIAKAIIAGATIPYSQGTAASKFYTNADALAGYTLSDMKPGDFYYDDVSASIYICIDTGLGYFDLLDLTVRA
jgi:hypothetical protein